MHTMTLTMTLAITVFFFVAVTVMIVAFGYRRYVVAGRTYETLNKTSQERSASVAASSSRFYSITQTAERLGRKLAPSAAAASALQRKLLAAGYRNQNAVAILYGLKLMVVAATTTGICVFELRSGASPMMCVIGIAIGLLAGFRLPDFFLARKVKQRQNKIRKALPDALDLIIVCAESGLTIDRSFRTVAQQLAIVHRELTDEFSLFTAEISAGLRRKDALENLAARTQEPEIRKFVAVLTQADRFGTSMGDALRTHADYLRTRRKQDAEEKASKVSVKMIFPIFFFIMPCMMLVTVGPAAIVIMKQLGPAMGGH